MGWSCKNKIVISSIVLLFTSCVSDFELKDVDITPIFHDNSSKVWMIKHQFSGKTDIAPLTNGMKYIITFHQSHNCYLQRMNTFGDESGSKGLFTVDSEIKELEISFKDQNWHFSLDTLTYTRIYLRSLDTSSFPYNLVLIPVPEP
jgi:hypothetical protein